MDLEKEKELFDDSIILAKQLRKDLDNSLQKSLQLMPCEASTHAQIKIKEAIMWLGMTLKYYGESSPYPNSMDTTNTIIDKTADDLKL